VLLFFIKSSNHIQSEICDLCPAISIVQKESVGKIPNKAFVQNINETSSAKETQSSDQPELDIIIKYIERVQLEIRFFMPTIESKAAEKDKEIFKAFNKKLKTYMTEMKKNPELKKAQEIENEVNNINGELSNLKKVLQ
jgi:hypothetical protein